MYALGNAFDVVTRYVFRLPNYVSAFGVRHGLRLLLEIETRMRHNGRRKSVFHVPGYPPITLRDSVSDRSTFWQCLVTRQYRIDTMEQNHDVLRRYRAILNSGKRPLIIDAGANIGLSALFFGKILPDAKVYCIEPEQENLSILRENTARLGSAVEVFPGAVWDTDEPLNILDPEAGSSAMQVVAGAEPVGPSVPVHTIAQLLLHDPKTEPFIIKLDIEGAQEFLFRSNTGWIDRFSLIILELDDWQFPWRGTSRAFFRALSDFDFDYVIRGESIFCFRHASAEPMAPSRAEGR